MKRRQQNISIKINLPKDKMTNKYTKGSNNCAIIWKKLNHIIIIIIQIFNLFFFNNSELTLNIRDLRY